MSVYRANAQLVSANQYLHPTPGYCVAPLFGANHDMPQPNMLSANKAYVMDVYWSPLSDQSSRCTSHRFNRLV
jgi:hypothetical protein